MKKAISLFLVCLMLCGVLAACSSDASTSSEQPSSDAASVSDAEASSDASSEAGAEGLSGTIVGTGWNITAAAMEEGAKRFMELNPGTEIVINTVADNTKLLTQLASGSDDIPDFMAVQNRDAMTYLEKYPDAFMDVTDVVEPQKDNLVPAVLATLEKDGKYYAFPWNVAPAGLFYRTDIFEEYGVDASKLATWDDFIEAGKTINEGSNGEVKMFGFDYNGASSTDMLMVMLSELGGNLLVDGKVTYNTPEMVKIFETVKKMMDADITMNLSSEWTDRITAINENKLCTVQYGIWFGGMLSTNCAEQSGKWGIIPLPAFEAGGNTQAISGGNVAMLSAKSKNPELAKAYAEWFLMGDEGADINLQVADQFSAYIPAYDNEAYNTENEYFGFSTSQWASEHLDTITPMTFPAYYTDVFEYFLNVPGKYFLDNGNLTTVLQEAQDAAQAQYDLLAE